jgi:pimeloyl-ACP methyl ester carboxylesterase
MTMNFIDTDGGTLAVEVRGEGPLVVCSPAMGDTRDAFDALADTLVAAGFRTAVFDLRGHGDSSTGFGSYGDLATAADIETVIEHLGGPAFVAGASLSAGAAVMVAARRPELVSGVVLLAPFLRNGVGEAMRAMLRLMVAKPWGPAVWRTYSKSLWKGLGKDGAAERAAASIATLDRPGRWREFQATVSGADHRVYADSLGVADVPALVVVGSADPDWKDPIAEARWVAEHAVRTPAEVVVADGAGHAPMLERPDVVSPAVLSFLQGVEGAAGRA